MKKILYIMCAVLMGALASCSNSDLEATDGTSALQSVRVSVYTDQSATRANAPEGIDRFAVEVFQDAAYTTAANVFEDGTTNKSNNSTGVFNMILDKTKSYYCLFWADNGESYTITDLQSVALVTDKAATEAFYGTSTITTAVKEQSVTLKRAVGKITLTETKALAVGTLTVKFSSKPGFNVATAKALGTEAERTATMDIKDIVAANAIFGDAIYAFADPDQKSLQDVVFTFQMTGFDAEPSFTVTNVPLQANYTTNIKGHFISKSAFSFDVTCEDIWGTPDNDTTFPEPDPKVIGYFSGEWIEVDENDQPTEGTGIWRLSKQLVVANKDVSATGLAWATGSETVGLSSKRIEGKSNTFTLYQQNGTYEYPAATACFKLNNGYEFITGADDVTYKWYLPAQNQLTAIWIVNKALTTGNGFTKLTTDKYWSSSEETSSGARNVNFSSGIVNYETKTTASSSGYGGTIAHRLVRCVRDL